MHLLIRNSTEKVKLPSGRIIHIPKCVTTFREWHGRPVPNYGRKALFDVDGKPGTESLTISIRQ